MQLLYLYKILIYLSYQNINIHLHDTISLLKL